MRQFKPLAVAGALLLTPVGAEAQDRAPDGPLLYAMLYGKTAVFHAAPETTAPDKRRMWSWTFARTRADLHPNATFDSAVTLYEYDCVARTGALLQLEVYEAGEYLSAERVAQPQVETPKAGSIMERLLPIACDGSARTDWVATAAEARTIALHMLAAQ
jgi:hypothetical protein